VVGLGASAGGLQALQHFFSAVPSAGGMAYVVIQHLPLDDARLLAEIIGRCTTMKVHQIEDGTTVESDHVYPIRPGRMVTLADGRLCLGEPVEKRGHHVDDFFRSLAREQKERAIAVVLSGMGTNGTAGAQAIKAAGGRGVHADGRPYQAADSPLARTLATGAAVVDEQLDFIRADGSRGRLAMSTAPVRTGEDEPVAVVAVFREVKGA
jgi:chemotaxis response regulator CheB